MIRSSEIWSFFYKCPRPNPLVASFLRLLSSKLHLLTFYRPESPPEFIWRTLVDPSPLLMIIVPDRFPSLCFGLSYFHSCSALNALSSGIPVFGSIVMLSPSILFRMPLCGATEFQWGIPFPLFSGQMSQMLLVCFCHLEIPPDLKSFSKEICSIQVACNVERKKSFPFV